METELFKIFIASPSDTNSERAVCDKVFNELNKSLGEVYGFRLESLKWENDVRPSIQAKEGQAIINAQIGDSYNIFIGIMSRKFGSPTSSAESGTEEEFNIALQRYINKEDVEVVFYFNDDATGRISDLNLQELSKIAEFKNKVSGLGIYGVYMGVTDFEEKLRRHLSQYFIQRFKKKSLDSTKINSDIINKEALRRIFSKRLNDSLIGFDDQPVVWIEPILSRTNEISQNPDENYSQRVPVNTILHSKDSSLIKAPTQFGLTSLAHYLVKEAWENDELWIYLDNNETKPHTIQNAVQREVEALGQKMEDVKCIVFDSWNNYEKSSIKKLKTIIDVNKDIRVIVMQSIDDTKFLEKDEDDNDPVVIDRKFIRLHLLALPRNLIRQVVSQYNKEKRIDDDDKVLGKVVSDLESLNIHRTPYNCLTILKISEKYFDESPVNRTKMIEMILFVLFDLGQVPRYKTKPDVKDCEYVLGKLSEIMIKNDEYEFTRDYFLGSINSFCKEKLIDLDTEVVFDVLMDNCIIISRNGKYCFRSIFWVYYFAARRMHSDKDFKEYIFETKKYTQFPEVIEFYTGIDRNRDDALKILLNDIKETCDIVHGKVGLGDDFSFFDSIQWKPTEDGIAKIQEEINENVINSNLPDALKDQYLDKVYDQKKPYTQSIIQILEEYSLLKLIQKIRASSTALRNSDYANPELKRELLNEIYRSWGQLSKVLFVLAPVMATKGSAEFGGTEFHLNGDFGESYEERLNTIIQVNPTNVVGYFQNDLFSPKISPLLFEKFNHETNSALKHHQALLIAIKRPNGWRKEIENYIISLKKNSFFLFDIVNILRAKYRYDFIDKETLGDISYLIKMGLAKHQFGDKKPGADKIRRISDSNLPKREFDEDV